MEDSADVIELGSSDEEPETSIKKVTKNKMKSTTQANPRTVQIPIQVKNATNIRNPFSGLPKTPPKNVRPLLKNIGPRHINPMSMLRSPIIVNGGGMRSLNPSTIMNQRIPINGQNTKIAGAQNKSCLTKLPPGITVTRTGGEKVKRKHFENPVNNLVIKRQKLDKRSKKAINPLCQVSTVDPGRNTSDVRLENDTPIVLDDDDQGSDEMVDEPMMEEVLNEDELTDTTPPVENIVIEDSPVKPVVANKLAQRMAAMEEIVIEDSPLKEVNEEVNQPETPDKEKCDVKTNEILEPHSKKKLEFTKSDDTPKDDVEKEDVKLKDDLEKEDVKQTDDVEKKDVKPEDNNEKNEDVKMKDVEKKDDKVKEDKEETKQEEMVKDDKVEKPADNVKPTMSAIEAKAALKLDDDLEYHPSYQRFIDLCLEMDKTSDMKKIVEKKVISYYKSVDKSFTSSQMFIDLVDEKVAAMKVHPNNLYLYIKDVVDELRVHRKTGRSGQSSSTKGVSSSGTSYPQKEKKKEKEAIRNAEPSEDELEEPAPSPSRKVRKLEKALRKLNRAIQKLEEQEVDFDEEGDSSYLLADNAANCALELAEMGGDIVRERDWKERYKARLLRVHAKLSRLTGMPHEKREHVRLEPRAGHPPGPARRLQAWLRRRSVAAGAPLPFPDFHDVVQCVREANRKDGLGWSESQIMEEARDLFVRVGRKLKRRRQEREWHSIAGMLPPTADPAEENPDLRSRLERNAKLAGKRVKEVIDRYADRQTMLRLEPQAVDEKEAEKSENSEDDEGDDEPSKKPGTSNSKECIPASEDNAVSTEKESLIAKDNGSKEEVETDTRGNNNDERMDVDEESSKVNDKKNYEKNGSLHNEKFSENAEIITEKVVQEVIEEKSMEDSATEMVQKDVTTVNIEENATIPEVTQEESTIEVIHDESVEEIIEENTDEQNTQEDITENIHEDLPEVIIQKDKGIKNVLGEVSEEIIQEDSVEEVIDKDHTKEDVEEVIQGDLNEETIQRDVVEENIEEVVDVVEEIIDENATEQNIEEKIDENEQQITVPVSDTDESNRILSSDNESEKNVNVPNKIVSVTENGKEKTIEQNVNVFPKDSTVETVDYENEMPVHVSDSEEGDKLLSSSDNDVNFVEKFEKSQDIEFVTKNKIPMPIAEDKHLEISVKNEAVNGRSNSESGVEIITSDRVESDIDELHLLKRVSGGRTDNSGLSDSSGPAGDSSQYSQNSQTSQNEDAVMDVDESSVDAPSNAEEEVVDLDKKALLEIDGDTEDETDGGRESDVVITCFNLASTEDECDDNNGQKTGKKIDAKEEIEAKKDDPGSIENVDSVDSVTSEVVLLN